MKLMIVLSLAALAASAPVDSYGAPSAEPVEAAEGPGTSPSTTPVNPFKSSFNFPAFYKGAFPPSTIPHANFLSQFQFPTQFAYKYPLKTYNYAPSQVSLSASPQGILPPISQIIPPISQIIPPALGVNSKPTLPINPSQVLPPQVLPPQVSSPQLLSKPSPYFVPQIPRYTYNYAFPTFSYNGFPQYPYFKTPTPLAFPTTTLLSAPATPEPVKAPEPCYGPPATAPVESSAPLEEQAAAGPAENSAPFEPSPVSFPYEPAAPDTPEPEAPHQPAQEYGPPQK